MIEFNSELPSVCEKHDTENEVTILRITEPISYDSFFRNILLRNIPCLLSDDFTVDWLARKYWTAQNGIPDVEYLDQNFGGANVPVANCEKKYYDSQEKFTMSLRDYISFWKQKEMGSDARCLYLKDWHFTKDFPHYGAYVTPIYFASDWLNEFWQERKDESDDYKFVYIGPKGTWTPFHADVFHSYSWSANVCGRKKWVFCPPGQERKLCNIYGEMIYDVKSEDLCDTSAYPLASSVVGVREVYQEAGEVIFVPSGWHHEVWNLEDTISINHNWINGSNIKVVWQNLLATLDKVEESIDDCKDMEDWHGQCQLILRSTFGMNFEEYFCFLKIITERRLKAAKGDLELTSFDVWKYGKNHILFDLQQLKWCFEELLKDGRIFFLQSCDFREEILNLIDIISSCL